MLILPNYQIVKKKDKFKIMANSVESKEAVLSYDAYDVDGELTHSIQISYTGQSIYAYPRTNVEVLVKKTNLQLIQFPNYTIKMDKDGSMERFFEEYNYKWNEERKRIEPA